MTPINVAILGLGRVGASVGLALKRHNAGKNAANPFQIAGYDPRAYVQTEAERLGAADSFARHPADAARGKDIVILSMPYSETQAAYRAVGESLRPGAVVLDLSPLKAPSLKWADANLPENAYMVGVTPVLNPAYLFDGLDDTEHARADLFDGGLLLLMPAPKCAKEAVELAADLAGILGATPHFMDADEHDGVSATMEGLPALLGLALFYTLHRGKGWADAQRLTNPAFGRLTHHLEDTHPDDLRDLLLNNRHNLVSSLDALVESLQAFRAALAQNNRDALEAALVEAGNAYHAWLSRRKTGRWDDPGKPVQGHSLMSGIMGDFLARRLRGEQDGEEE